jgi:uncharacterized damage-inducible protein DinB
VVDVDNDLARSLLDSWERNNTILVNLLGMLRNELLEVRAMETSPSIGEMLTHMHYVRLACVLENVPDFAVELPEEQWASEHESDAIAEMLTESARAVRDAVSDRIRTGRPMDLDYDHPILALQHLIWHEGYHHGQIKLALKLAGIPLSDDDAGPGTWGVWMDQGRPS